MKKRPNLLFYLLINILVSAVTVIVVLWAWDNVWNLPRRPWGPAAPQTAGSQVLGQDTAQPVVDATNSVSLPMAAATNPTATTAPAPIIPQATAGPTETALPADAKLIEVVSVVGAGDLNQEVVLLKRVGEGNLSMAGWKLTGEHDNTYTFPEQPELTLYKDGAVQLYTGSGTDTVTEVYWNRSEAAWRSGETLRLLDPQGNERATFVVP